MKKKEKKMITAMSSILEVKNLNLYQRVMEGIYLKLTQHWMKTFD